MAPTATADITLQHRNTSKSNMPFIDPSPAGTDDETPTPSTESELDVSSTAIKQDYLTAKDDKSEKKGRRNPLAEARRRMKRMQSPLLESLDDLRENISKNVEIK